MTEDKVMQIGLPQACFVTVHVMVLADKPTFSKAILKCRTA